MSQKTLWVVVAVVVIAGLLWYAGLIPGLNNATAPGYSQGAAAANATNPGVAPSAGAAVTLVQKASAGLTAAGKDANKVKAVSVDTAAAIAALSALLPQMQLAVNVSSNKGNNLDAVGPTLQDYATRVSALNSISVSISNAATIAAGLNAIVADISKVNTALQGAKFK